MNTDELRAILTSGIEAARNNNPILARQSFREVLAEDPNNELAWMWLAQVVDIDDQRREALQNVLRINPDNNRAREALRRLGDDAPDPNRVQSRLSQARENTETVPSPPTSQAQQQVFVPKKTDKQNRPNDLWSANRGDKNNNRLMYMLLIVLVGVLLIIFGLVLLIAQVADKPVTETATPTDAIIAGGGDVDVSVPTATPAGPTATFVVILETATPPATLPPTAIPSQTPVPTETPIPVPPDGSLTLLYISGSSLNSVRDDGSSNRGINIEAGSDGATVQLSQADLSNDGDTLVFAASANGVQELFKSNANGSNVEQLTNLRADETIDPAWSPNGQYIAFASNINNNFDIYIVSANGGIPRRVTSTPDNERQPVWSPDGRYLAYTVSPTSLDSEIYVVEIGQISDLSQPLVEDNTSENACQITRANNSSYSPSFSPDGTRLAFVSNRDTSNETDVYIMNVDGSGLSLITPNDGKSQEQSVAWSPDGRWLAVTTTRNASVINDGGFDSGSDIPSGVLDDTPVPLPVETVDANNSNATPASDSAQEPTVAPTLRPTIAPTETPPSAQTTLWLYDIEAKLWYQVSDSAATNVFWQPLSGSTIAVAEDIRFNCIQ